MLKCIVDDLNRGRKTAKVLKPDVYVKSWLQTKAIAWLMMQEPGKSTVKKHYGTMDTMDYGTLWKLL